MPKQHFNTITEGFTRHVSPKTGYQDAENLMRSTLITQSQSSSINEQMFNPGPQWNKAHMSRTIMEPATRWNSFNQAGARFNPNKTGFSMLTSHLDKISQLSRRGNVDLKTLNTERRDRPLSLEMKPEQ